MTYVRFRFWKFLIDLPWWVWGSVDYRGTRRFKFWCWLWPHFSKANHDLLTR